MRSELIVFLLTVPLFCAPRAAATVDAAPTCQVTDKSSLKDAVTCAETQIKNMIESRAAFSSAPSAKGNRPFDKASDLQSAIAEATTAENSLNDAADAWGKDPKRSPDAATLKPFIDELDQSIKNGSQALVAMMQAELGITSSQDQIQQIYKGADDHLNESYAAASATKKKAAADLVTTASDNAKADTAAAADSKGFTDGTKPVRKMESAARQAVIEAINEDTRQAGTELRTIVGMEQTGAAGADSTQNFFINFFVSHPLTLWPHTGDTSPEPRDGLGPHWRYFGDVRISSAPQQQNSTLGDLAAGFGGAVTKLPSNQIAQSGEFLAGLGYRVGSFAKPFFRADGDRERIAVYLIAAAGAIGSFSTVTTPTAYEVPGAAGTTPNPQQLQLLCAAEPQMFTLGPGGCTDPKTVSNYSYLAFKPATTNQFFSQGYAGFRLISHDDCSAYPSHPCARAGARLDITFGENQAVTNGTFSHPVWRFEGFYPITLKNGNSLDNVLYFFGSAYIQARRPGPPPAVSQLVLAPAGSNFNAFNSTTYYVPALPSFRDYSRIGFGVDFYRLVTNYLNKSQGPTGNQNTGGTSQNNPGGKATPASATGQATPGE